MLKFIFVVLSKYFRSSQFLQREHVLIWNIDKDLLLFGMFKVWISSISYLHFTTLSGSLFVWFSVILLNWLNNWLRLAGCFKTNVLVLFILPNLRESVRFCLIKEIKFCLLKLPIAYISELQLRQYQGSLQPDKYW